MRKILFSVLTVAVVVLGFPAPAHAAGSPAGTYTGFNSPSTGYYNIDTFQRPEATSESQRFFSTQFWFDNGDAAYIGLQDKAALPGAYGQKAALFSVWSANGARGNNAAPFSGEGSGYSVHIPYNWVPGHLYRLRVWDVQTDSLGKWYGSWVIDETTAVETYIGDVRVPLSWTGINTSATSWSEYFGPGVEFCEDIPYSSVRFYAPHANANTVTFGEYSSWVDAGSACNYNSRVTHPGDGSAKQEMGLGCRVRPNTAVIYRDSNYGGPCRVLTQGDHPQESDLDPIFGNGVSSVKVASGMTLRLCDGVNFGGTCDTYTADTSLVAHNDTASSAQVSVTPPPPPKTCIPFTTICI